MKRLALLFLLALACMLSLPSCSPAATQAVVSAASSILSEVLLKSSQASTVLDLVEQRVDALQLPPDLDKRVRLGIAACRAANSAALTAVHGVEQTAASANAAFAPFRQEWAALAQVLEQIGILGADGTFKAEPGQVAIPQPLALRPIGE